MNQGSDSKKQRISFELLDSDLTMHGPEHVNRIFLLDTTKVPDGQPTGVEYEKFDEMNYPDLAESELKEDFLPFLVRKCAVNRLNAFRTMMKNFDRHGRIDKKGTILKGPADAGKSYVLYHVVQFCRASGWLVLYVPTLGSLNDYSNESAARTILKGFLEAEAEKLKDIEYEKGLSLHDFISSGLGDRKNFETWDALFSVLRSEELKYPVLVAVDEWNAKFDVSACQDLLDYFGLQKLRSGFWLYAISSSFDPISGFRNADKQTLPVDIPRYTQQEFNAILNSLQHFKRLPEKIDDKEIDYHSGRMPRMIFFWCQASRGNLQASFNEVLRNFNKLAEDYYRQRIYKTLARAQESSREDRRDVFQVAAHVCLNTPVWSLPELWGISGLFIDAVDDDGVSYFACVCPSVSNAFMKHLSDKKDLIISVLARDPETKGRAFELLVTFRFHTYSKTIVTLQNKDLSGNLRDPKRLHVVVNRVIMQAGHSTDEPLRPGTLLILHKGHRVCDLVVYSENLGLYFIQISVQSYMDHDKKAPNLKDELAKTGKTVLEYYMNLCQTSDGIQQFAAGKSNDLDINALLPKGVYYVYISMSNSLVKKKTKCSKHPVVLVRQDDLGATLGELWESYKTELLAGR